MVNIRKTKTKEYVTIECSGHTEYEAAGKDIVCAAVSILTQTLIRALEDIGADISVSYSGNQIKEITIYTPSMCEYADIEFAAAGYRMLAEHYPDNVSFEE